MLAQRATNVRVQSRARCNAAVLPKVQSLGRVVATAAGAASTEQVASTSASLPVKELHYETDKNGLQRVKYDKEGWNFWQWQGHKVHWAVAGPKDAPPVLLIHGYGASAYHWRYNIPELSKKYRVYALCLLGFGWSQKALVDYTNGRQWVAQISDFIEQVVRPDLGASGAAAKVALAGNSLGGYASLATGSARPDLVRAVALLNGAGPFDDPTKPPRPEEPAWYEPALNAVVGAVKRVVLFFAFMRAKQPARIKEVLDLVYVSKDSVDGDLVDSIVRPALDPAASEVFYRINHRTQPPVTVNKLLAGLQVPLLLLWGLKDPWITPSRADAVRSLYPSASFVGLSNAGHCPHDDSPKESNEALLNWLDTLPAA
mmetsp:Transcript_28195/g.71897  ORF Transcript_28195/g.71897 Transcript_28195/m.71897 type:complete len:372 (-) Transcript_28195:235-1350(-)